MPTVELETATNAENARRSAALARKTCRARGLRSEPYALATGTAADADGGLKGRGR
jgi:hypothetical protein